MRLILFALGSLVCIVISAPLAFPQPASVARRVSAQQCTLALSTSALEAFDPADATIQRAIAETCSSAAATARGVQGARARFYAGRAYNRIPGQHDEAIRLLEIAVNAGPEFGGAFERELRAARLELAQAYRAAGRLDASRNILSRASPSDPAAAYQRALLTLAELGDAGREGAFDALRSSFVLDDAQLRGALTPAEVRNGRSLLFALGMRLGQESLQQQARDHDQRRGDALRAINYFQAAATALSVACPQPQPLACAGGLGATERFSAPSPSDLSNAFFLLGIAHLKAAGVQDARGSSGRTGDLDCLSTQQSPDLASHFQSARLAFQTVQSRAGISQAAAADANWGLGCTVLANAALVADPSERQRQLTQAMEYLRQASDRPIAVQTMAQARQLLAPQSESQPSILASSPVAPALLPATPAAVAESDEVPSPPFGARYGGVRSIRVDPRSGRLQVVMGDGTLLNGAIENGVLTLTAPARRDARLALAPPTPWRGPVDGDARGGELVNRDVMDQPTSGNLAVDLRVSSSPQAPSLPISSDAPPPDPIPEEVNVLLTRARAQALQGQLDGARADYQRALAMVGPDAQCQRGREPSVRARADVPARIYLELAQTRLLEPQRPNDSDLFARTITQISGARSQALREAEAELQCAVSLNYDNSEARLTLGHIYLRLGAAGELDPPPFNKALQALRYFERPLGSGQEGRAEGLYLLSRRETLLQQSRLIRGNSGSAGNGTNAVGYAAQAYNMEQRPEYRRQVCMAQMLFGNTREEGYCTASGRSDERAESLLYEGMYWLRRGQRESENGQRMRSWSLAIQAFNRGSAEASGNMQVETVHPSLPSNLALQDLLRYGERYVLRCSRLDYGDRETAADEVRAFFRLSGMPDPCGGAAR